MNWQLLVGWIDKVHFVSTKRPVVTPLGSLLVDPLALVDNRFAKFVRATDQARDFQQTYWLKCTRELPSERTDRSADRGPNTNAPHLGGEWCIEGPVADVEVSQNRLAS